ncbi:DUF2634 domain-containing protein [Paenibacillus anseongense]|uniref:DUF2634 domain-containing protein n=1 Tax=Paenibacillus anseongense TaxID=2682845 RepID=UPI002DB66E33|nr:DUF2634 domain-containing protein [Paenibacillus anseongense]MEC0269419.1 DUF2634 domain-containing protein [Paenibacillus anseongense]
MIPTGGMTNAALQQSQQPSRTYRIDLKNGRIVGTTDGLEAVKQAVYKILGTERFEYLIYGPDYGSEYGSLIGGNSVLIRSELARRISEALMQDDRITDVQDMKVTITGDSALAEFTVVSQYGSYQTEKGVSGVV